MKRFAIAASILLALSGMAVAQRTPQLTWEGLVSEGADLFIHGNNVDAQGRTTGAVDRPRISFTNPLPAAAQRVEVETRRGRGRVEVVEQPGPDNDYTATVRIDARGTRPELYSLNFYWDPSVAEQQRGAWSRNGRGNRRADRNDGDIQGRTADSGQRGEMTWSGRVDGEALVEIRGQRATVRTLRGQRVTPDEPRFSVPMPRQDVAVRLEDVQGRGRVELVDQPTSANNYTALVRIFDEEGGAGQYSFRLVWDGGGSRDDRRVNSRARDPYRANDSGILTPGGTGSDNNRGPHGNNERYGNTGPGTIRWSGRVDDTVRINVQGSRVWSSLVSGGPIGGEQVSTGSALPTGNTSVDVRKLRGRGDVRVIQQPDSRNSSTMVIEIRDKDGGADDYEVEIGWR